MPAFSQPLSSAVPDGGMAEARRAAPPKARTGGESDFEQFLPRPPRPAPPEEPASASPPRHSKAPPADAARRRTAQAAPETPHVDAGASADPTQPQAPDARSDSASPASDSGAPPATDDSTDPAEPAGVAQAVPANSIPTPVTADLPAAAKTLPTPHPAAPGIAPAGAVRQAALAATALPEGKVSASPDIGKTPPSAGSKSASPSAIPGGPQGKDSASRANFAVPRQLDPGPAAADPSGPEKKPVHVYDKLDTTSSALVGISSAQVIPAMSPDSSANAAERAVSAGQQAASGGTQLPATAGADAAQAANASAHEAVAAVIKLVEAQASRAQGVVSSVNLSFKFGEDDLSVRVQWQGGVVQTQFRTNAPELNEAIANEWQAMASANTGRPLSLAAPEFSVGDNSQTASGSGDSRQSSQSGFSDSDGSASGSGPASPPPIPSGSAGPRRPTPLIAASRLHAFA